MIWQLEYNFVSITELPKNALTFRIEKSDTWPVATTQKKSNYCTFYDSYTNTIIMKRQEQ